MKLQTLMMQHIEAVSKPEFAEYFALDVDPCDPTKPVVAVDLETPWIGSDEWSFDCKPTTWAFYTEDTNVVKKVFSLVSAIDAPKYHTPNGMVFTYNAWSHRTAIQWILDNCCTVYHNSNFDLHRFEQNGFKVPRPGDYQDTLAMAYVLNYRQRPGIVDLKLATLARLVGLEKIAATAEDFAAVNDTVFARNLSDCEITFKVYKSLCNEMNADNRVKKHYQYVDLPFSMLVREMERVGFHVDLNAVNEFNTEVQGKFDALNEELRNYCAWVPSGTECGTFTMESEGVVTKKNKHGEISTMNFKREPAWCLIDGKDEASTVGFGDLLALGQDEPEKFTVLNYAKLKKNGEPSKRTVKAKYCYFIEEAFTPTNARHKLHVLTMQGFTPDETTPRTPNGEISVSKELIQSLSKSIPMASTLLEISQLGKILSTYLKPLLRYSTEVAPGIGHIHPSFNQWQTKTGRLSSGDGKTSPNFQNLPNRSPEGKKVRKFLIPRPGLTMVLGDDSQIEARLFADYLARHGGDDRLLASFVDPTLDFHSENVIAWNIVRVAAALRHPDWTEQQCIVAEVAEVEKYRSGYYKEHPDEFKASLFTEARNLAKTIIYGLLYGAGATKLGNGDYARGKTLIDTLYGAMPSILQLKQKVWDVCEASEGFVYNMFGRRGYYPDIVSEDKERSSSSQRESFNYLLQSSSFSRIATRAIVGYPLQRKFGADLFAQEHDALGYEIDPDTAPAFAAAMSEVFSASDCLETCPVAFEFHPSPSWGDK